MLLLITNCSKSKATNDILLGSWGKTCHFPDVLQDNTCNIYTFMSI